MIRNGITVFYVKEWYDKDIKYVEHLFDYRKKDLYSFEHLRE
jgi:hypothetical protein